MSPGRDTRTKFQGVYRRHRSRCLADSCNCDPSYYGVVWDRVAGKQRKTRRYRLLAEAHHARADLLEAIADGRQALAGRPRVEDAAEKFVAAAREGVALNKWGRPYRRRAVDDLDSSLRRLGERFRKRRMAEITRGDVQAAIDELVRAGLSGSRVRSVVNAVRSLYGWAQDRDLADHDPAARVRLPAMNAKPRDRVATPAEFAQLLSVLEPELGLPFALAGYGTARSQEIRTLDWAHVDLGLDAIELAADEEGRKPGGSWRVVPLVEALQTMLCRAWSSQGRPTEGKVCPPLNHSKSGLISLDHLQAKARRIWTNSDLRPIGLHEARHTAATWLDHAGVSPKVASQLMGHKTPDYQAGAAAITLRRYTHTLPGELERARDLLNEFLAARENWPVASSDRVVRSP